MAMDEENQEFLTDQPARFVAAEGLSLLWPLLKETALRLYADEAMPLAGNIAFRTILSVFPFLIFVTSLAGFIGTADIAQTVISFLLTVAPAELVKPLESEIKSILTVQRGGVLSVSLLLMAWSASGGVDSVRVALNRAYDCTEHRHGLVLLMQNLAFVVGGAVTLLALGFLIVVLPLAVAVAQRYVPAMVPSIEVYATIRYPLAIVALIAWLFAVHALLPAQRRRFGDLWPGSVVTLIVWIVLAEAYAYYLGQFANYASTYAGLAGVIAALFFVYLAALVLILGGEVNRVLRLRRQWRERRQDIGVGI